MTSKISLFVGKNQRTDCDLEKKSARKKNTENELEKKQKSQQHDNSIDKMTQKNIVRSRENHTENSTVRSRENAAEKSAVLSQENVIENERTIMPPMAQKMSGAVSAYEEVKYRMCCSVRFLIFLHVRFGYSIIRAHQSILVVKMERSRHF